MNGFRKKKSRALREACDRFTQVTRTQDAVKIAEADVALHDIVYRGAGMKAGPDGGKPSQQMYRYRLEYIKDVEPACKGLLRNMKRFTDASAAGTRMRVRGLLKCIFITRSSPSMNQIQQYKGSSRV